MHNNVKLLIAMTTQRQMFGMLSSLEHTLSLFLENLATQGYHLSTTHPQLNSFFQGSIEVRFCISAYTFAVPKPPKTCFPLH